MAQDDFEDENDDFEDGAEEFLGGVEEEDAPEESLVVPESPKPPSRHAVLPQDQAKPEPAERKWHQAPEGGGSFVLTADGRRVRKG